MSRQWSGILRVAGPLVGDAHPAGEADPAVHHQQLAVGAVVDPRQGVPVERVETVPDLHPGVAHLLQQLASILMLPTQSSSTCTGTPALRALDERLGERLADVARPVDDRFRT